jgi:enamine deaminase RidA (YjgF/YER057c/UK114 family)
VGETVGEQTRRALENLDVVARAGGGSLQNAVRVGVYVRNLESFAEINATYREFFREPFPARTTVQSNLIGFDVEIDAIVWLGS